jgi:hypothetical protein
MTWNALEYEETGNGFTMVVDLFQGLHEFEDTLATDDYFSKVVVKMEKSTTTFIQKSARF